MAEDEEGCLDEYKRKGLVARSANFVCPSPLHNSNSSAVSSIVYDGEVWKKNVTVIGNGVRVEILATKCDGRVECFNGYDEENCGFNVSITVLLGKIRVSTTLRALEVTKKL